MKNLKNFLRWRKIKKRVKKRLPKYHPETGIKFRWNFVVQRTLDCYSLDKGYIKYRGLAKLVVFGRFNVTTLDGCYQLIESIDSAYFIGMDAVLVNIFHTRPSLIDCKTGKYLEQKTFYRYRRPWQQIWNLPSKSCHFVP